MGCNDYYYDDERERKYNETTWKLANDYVCSPIMSNGNAPWTCLKCFALVQDTYCRDHRKVCR